MTDNWTVAPGWERVAEEFARCLSDRNDLGSAVAVYHRGQPVVDLWGGVADGRTGRPWQRDTAALVFSTTKGATAICAHMLVERGELDLDAPVATYWPEFAQGGKEGVPVRWLLTHQVGLPYVDADLAYEDLLAHTPVVEALAAQKPLWEPGTAHAYHAVTFGHLVGEVIHRVTGRTLGQFFHDEVATPLGLRAWIGLPDDPSIDVAWIEPHDDPPVPEGPGMAEFVEVFARSIHLGGALPLALVNGQPGDFNDPRTLAIELGGSNMVADARSLSRMYAATVSEVDGMRLLSDATIARAATPQTLDSRYFRLPPVLPGFMDFAVGFQNVAELPGAFGHGGAGGSLAFADRERELAFAYVMNRMDATAPDDRAASLVRAAVGCCA